MKTGQKMRTWVLGVMGAGVILGSVVAVRSLLHQAPARVWVEGRPVAWDEPLGSWLESRKPEFYNREVDLQIGGYFYSKTYRDLGLELDVSATMRAVWRATPGVSERIRTAIALSRGQWVAPVEVEPVFRVNLVKAREALEEFGPLVHRDPISAKLDLSNHRRIEDVPGEDLDVETTLARLAQLDGDQHKPVAVATRAVPAAVTTVELGKIDISRVVSSFETTFATWGVGAGRAVNIANAAKRIDGTVLAPGETFSYNDTVGPRTEERGFTHAPEIVDDELQDGIGGGVCQVASTVFASALFSAFEIVERSAHGRPSAYTQPGLDATVAYGKVDLKFKNTLPYPVVLHVFLPKSTVVRAEVLGGEPRAKVAYSYGVGRSEEFFRRITYKPFLAHGKIVQKQKGRRGATVTSKVVVNWFDGREEERFYVSPYRPVPEVFWVGPGFDEGELPDMPEGATRVQRRGVPKPTASNAVALNSPTGG